jgi:PAS domain S-box-containing protein
MSDRKKTKKQRPQDVIEKPRQIVRKEERGGSFDPAHSSPEANRSAYWALFESVGDAVFLIRDNLFVGCNARASRMFACNREDIVGRSFDQFSPLLQPNGMNSMEPLLGRMAVVAPAGPQSFKWRFLRYDQMAFDAEVSISRITVDGERLLQVIVHEMGERGDAEEALRESENKFRNLSEKSLVGVYLIQDWKFKYVNPTLAEIFGYAVEEVIEGIKPEDVVLPEDWPLVRENIRRRIEGETTSIHSTFRVITTEREIRYVEVYGSRTTYQGKPALVGTLLDITDRKRSEARLRQAERKYRSIFENAVEGIFQTTPEGRLVAANPAHARMLGYGSPEELISSLTDVSHPFYVRQESRKEFMEMLEREGIALGFECELYKKDGSTIWVSLSARQVCDSDDNTLFHEGTIEDITEKKKVENELRQLNEFNKAIIDHAPVAVFTLDRNGVFTSQNPALGALLGLGSRAEEKLIGFNWVKNPYTIQCGLARHIEGGLKGEPFQLWDFPFMTYRGDRNIFMDFKGVPLKDKNGEIEGLLCIIEETTDRVKTRAKLMQEAKTSVIGRLAAGIAHELNNPLGTLVAYSERAASLIQSFQGADVERLKGYLTIIEEEAFRCKGVTTDILSLFQKEGLEIIEIDMDELLDSLLELLNTSQVKIIRERSLPLPHIMGDVSALRQVFVNLIANSVDAVEGRADAAIWIRTKPAEDHLLVEIEDNGTGIPDSIVEKIFEPFFTTKESKSGIGLGLSLCHDLVKDMGGTIKVVSTPGHGTTFSVSFQAGVR